MKYQKLFVVVSAALLLMGVFYWFEWRPAEARKVCFTGTQQFFKDKTSGSMQEVTEYYEFCLHKRGLVN